MTTSARFYKFPGYKTETPTDVLDDPEWVKEAEWMRSELRACGCICCHDSTQGYEQGFATAFDVGAQGVWTDTFTDFGLLTASGHIDTTLLGGSFDPATNHGFDRNHTIFPTTDVPRMKAFFEGEIARRGLTEEQIQELDDKLRLVERLREENRDKEQQLARAILLQRKLMAKNVEISAARMKNDEEHS